MTKADFTEQLELVRHLALLIRTVPDLTEFLADCERAQVIAPFLDPTLWLKGTDKLEDWQKVARAIHTCKGKIEQALEEALQREPAKA